MSRDRDILSLSESGIRMNLSIRLTTEQASESFWNWSRQSGLYSVRFTRGQRGTIRHLKGVTYIRTFIWEKPNQIWCVARQTIFFPIKITRNFFTINRYSNIAAYFFSYHDNLQLLLLITTRLFLDALYLRKGYQLPSFPRRNIYFSGTIWKGQCGSPWIGFALKLNRCRPNICYWRCRDPGPNAVSLRRTQSIIGAPARNVPCARTKHQGS